MHAGFSKEGRLLALDMFVVMDNGPYEQQHDGVISGRMASLLYQPKAMRWRGAAVLTNTPTRAAQTAPGGLQASALIGPILAKAARFLNLDPLAVCRINAPEGRAPVGPPKPDGSLNSATSAFLKEALDRGAETFGWQARRARPPLTKGPVRRGIGVGTGCFVAGTIGFDGLFVITPEGRLRIHSGIGNLGTESFCDVQRVLRDRPVWDFPLVNISAAMKLSGDRIDRARFVLGAVAARPWRLPKVEAAVAGRSRRDVADQASIIAVEGAAPLPYNGYKVTLASNLVKRAILGRQAS